MSLIITLMAIALVLFFFEIIVPGGILAVIGGILMLIACVIAYTDLGPLSALFTFFVALGISIGMLILEIKILPKTALGKKFFLKTAVEGSSNIPQTEENIIGKKGESLTTMAPTGKILIEGKEYEATANSGLFEAGTPVEVVNYDNYKVIVKKALVD